MEKISNAQEGKRYAAEQQLKNKIKSYVLLCGHRRGGWYMRDGTDEIIKTELYAEIETLEKQYRAIKDYLLGKEYESLEIIGTLRAFRNTLSKISMHILTLYTLEGQKTKITWDSLFTNIDNALERLQASARSKPRPTIQLALNMSEPKIEDVMSYLLTLKKSLQ